MFDYEIDSDDEWEEEDPGESIHGTDNEEEPEDEYEVDNDVFVPHGYLSDEEGQDNDSDVSMQFYTHIYNDVLTLFYCIKD